MFNPVFLCIITPVFDKCFNSFKDLILTLHKQSFTDFIHVAISDGESPRIKELIKNYDSRFIYTEIPATNPETKMDRFTSIVTRRDFGIQRYKATRYIFLDADIQLLSNDYFYVLYKEHQKFPTKLLLTKVKRGSGLYFPSFPFRCGLFDIANLCFTQEMAKLGYPTDFDILYPYANDFRFFNKIQRFDFRLINFVSAEKEGNKKYKNLREYKNECE